MNDLFDMLSRMGIEPIGQTEVKRSDRRFTEHRTIEPPKDEPVVSSELDGIDLDELAGTATDSNMTGKDAIGLGDKVVLVFGDDQKRISVRLSESSNDVEKGRLSVNSALGKAILGAEEGAEVEFMENERQRTVLIDSVEKTSIFTIDPQRARPDETALAIA